MSLLSHDIVEALRQSSAAFDSREETHDRQSHFIERTMTKQGIFVSESKRPQQLQQQALICEEEFLPLSDYPNPASSGLPARPQLASISHRYSDLPPMPHSSLFFVCRQTPLCYRVSKKSS
ncbi:hypothetical protein E2C01_059012 [Portunus trituberculatus]|uniref:Uncharacterized protein n=1 Tax=Portunus trituberculatus TaxID=210409 RepID=A0A5B7GY01_PORTR|nr:hypothetical protein [Portunus trituberculatus]